MLYGHNWGICRKCGKEHVHAVGTVPWNRGLKLGPITESRSAKLSASLKGHKLSEATKAKISVSLMGHTPNNPEKRLRTYWSMTKEQKEELRQKLSISHKGLPGHSEGLIRAWKEGKFDKRPTVVPLGARLLWHNIGEMASHVTLHYHRSYEEMEVCKKLFAVYGDRLWPSCRVSGRWEIDFVVFDGGLPELAIEYHPYDFNGKSFSEYKRDREDLLSSFGIRDIYVCSSIEQIEEIVR